MDDRDSKIESANSERNPPSRRYRRDFILTLKGEVQILSPKRMLPRDSAWDFSPSAGSQKLKSLS